MHILCSPPHRCHRGTGDSGCCGQPITLYPCTSPPLCPCCTWVPSIDAILPSLILHKPPRAAALQALLLHHATLHALLPQPSCCPMGCSAQAAAPAQGCSCVVPTAVPPPGHIRGCIRGSSVSTCGNVLHAVSMGCRELLLSVWSTSHPPAPSSGPTGLLPSQISPFSPSCC